MKFLGRGLSAGATIGLVMAAVLAVAAWTPTPGWAGSATIVAGGGRWVIGSEEDSSVGRLAFQFRGGEAALCDDTDPGCQTRGLLLFSGDDGLELMAVPRCLVIEGDHAWLGLTVFVGTDLVRGVFNGAALVVDSQDLVDPDRLALEILLEGKFDCVDQAMRARLLGHARAPVAGATIIQQM